MKSLLFQIHGNTDHANSGLIELINELLVFLTQLSSQSGGGIVRYLLPGVASLDNFHPLLVHFPIAFLLSFAALDILASLLKKTHWRETAGWLLSLGTVSALFTVIAGFLAANSVPHGENVHAVMERHEHLGVAVLSLATVLTGWRWLAQGNLAGETNLLYLILSGLLGMLVLLEADWGGNMVYQYGVAVQAVPEPIGGYFQQHSHQHDE